MIILLYQPKLNFMDMENKPLFGLTIEGNTANTISSSVQWGRILAICGIILGVLFVIFGIVFQVMMSRATSGFGGFESDGMSRSMALGAGVGMVMYILMGGLTIVGNIFLLNYANKTGTALKTNDSAMLNSGFAGLRNYFAFWAIIMIISLLFMLLGLVMML
jgi:predicted DNA repair protein MutK